MSSEVSPLKDTFNKLNSSKQANLQGKLSFVSDVSSSDSDNYQVPEWKLKINQKLVNLKEDRGQKNKNLKKNNKKENFEMSSSSAESEASSLIESSPKSTPTPKKKTTRKSRKDSEGSSSPSTHEKSIEKPGKKALDGEESDLSESENDSDVKTKAKNSKKNLRGLKKESAGKKALDGEESDLSESENDSDVKTKAKNSSSPSSDSEGGSGQSNSAAPKTTQKDSNESDSSSVGRPDPEPEIVKKSSEPMKKVAKKRKAEEMETNQPGSSKSSAVKRRRRHSKKDVGEDPLEYRLSKLRKYIFHAGLFFNYKIQFDKEKAETNKEKIRVLENFLIEKGLEKPFTLENCKKYKKKMDFKRDIESLGSAEILESRTGGRVTRSSRQTITTVTKSRFAILEDETDSETSEKSDKETTDKIGPLFAGLQGIVSDEDD